MSDYREDKETKILNKYTWCEIWDSLYYRFIFKNHEMLKKRYATARNVSHWDKKTKKEQDTLLGVADEYIKFLF